MGNYALFTPAVIALLLIAVVAAQRGLHQAAVEADYVAYLTAGKMIASGSGDAAQLYDPALQASVQQPLLVGSDIQYPGGLLGFVNPPLVALPFVPLSYLPAGAGFVIWDIVQIAALLVALWLLRMMLDPEYYFLLWVGTAMVPYYYQSIFMGQCATLMLLSITLFWWGVRAGGEGDWWGGAALGLLWFKPQLLPLLVLFLLYKRNFRALAGFAAASTLAYLLSALVSGLNWPGAYLNMINWLNRQPDEISNEREMLTLRAVLDAINLHSDVLVLLLSAILVTIFFYACWRSDQRGHHKAEQRVGNLELQIAGVVLLTAFTSLHIHAHDLIILVFSGAALLGWAAQRGWETWLTGVVVLNLVASLAVLMGRSFHAFFIVTVLITLATLLYLLIQPPPVRQRTATAAGN